MNTNENKLHYNGIDGLRTIGCICIVLLHVYSNLEISIDNFIFNNFVSYFGSFVNMFFMISSFSLCCGYYEKFENKNIDLKLFYRSRFLKIIPFFGFVCLIDLILNFDGITTIYEFIANISLLFGFMPNNKINMIGVGWYLGILFVFYIIFPFYYTCICSKKRAWLSFVVSIILMFIVKYHFSVNYDGTTIFNYLPYLFGGSLLYLYRYNILEFVKKIKLLWMILTILSFIACYMTPNFIGNFDVSFFKYIIFFSILIIAGISCDGIVLSNKFTKFISKNSLEIYLSHMILYRLVEKASYLFKIQNQFILFVICFLLVFLLTIFFCLVVKYIFKKIKFLINRHIETTN